MLEMKIEKSMGNLTIYGWDLSKLWHAMEIMPICYMKVMEISLEEDLRMVGFPNNISFKGSITLSIHCI
jgi:hypothetical protein